MRLTVMNFSFVVIYKYELLILCSNELFSTQIKKVSLAWLLCAVMYDLRRFIIDFISIICGFKNYFKIKFELLILYHSVGRIYV